MKNCVRRLPWSKECLFVVVAAACSNPPPAVSPKPATPAASVTGNTQSSAPAQAKPIPELPSGAATPVEHAALIPATVVSAEQTGDTQTFLVTIPQAAVVFEEPFDAVVTVPGEGQLLSVLGAKTADARVEVWLRRRLGSPDLVSVAATSTQVDVYTAADLRSVSSGVEPGHHYRISVELPAPAGLKPNPQLFRRYLDAVIAAAPAGSPSRWLLDPSSNLPRVSRGDVSAEWTEWMRLTSGYDSIEAALATAPNLRDVVAPQSTTIALKTLTPPALRRHPWAEMLKALPDASAQEALAGLVPADFYFVRSRSFEAFQSLMKRVDELVSPLLGISTKRREVLDLSERYRLELGLPEGELTRVLGPSLISTLAVVGSDPLLRQGSDVSILMAVPSAKAVTAALAVRRAELGTHLPLTEVTWKHGGTDVVAHTSQKGEVRQHVAMFTASTGEEYVLVSNSPNATRRILDVWAGKTTNLRDELDFQYMLRRDPVKEDVLAYLSDKFVAQVVSPRQRILEVRRQVAKSELTTVGYAALIHAQLFGTLPSDLPSLVKTKWLSPKTKHTTGEAIAYSPTDGARSSWGNAARLTSIIDLPTPLRVSKTEQQAYQSFVESYERHWGENIDPIALRITTTSTALDAHVRILPVANVNDYSEIARFSGGGSTTRTPAVEALSAILAIGEQSELRSMLSQQGESFLGARLALDWLGDWVEVGLADDALLAETALVYGEFPQPPKSDARHQEPDFDVLAKLPLYMTIDIKSAAGAALLLTKLRELATEAAPDVVRWGELKTKGEHKIVSVSFDEVNIYYSLTKSRLTLSPDLPTLVRLLEQTPAANVSAPARAPAEPKDGGQLVVEYRPRGEQSALRAVAAWFAEAAVRDTGVYNPLADLLLSAVPATNDDAAAYAQLSLSHLGGIPVTADGKYYRRTDSGLLDPARGTAHAPKWPRVPVDGGVVEHILRTLRRLRTEVSIDAEPGSPGVTSLRTRVLLER